MAEQKLEDERFMFSFESLVNGVMLVKLYGEVGRSNAETLRTSLQLASNTHDTIVVQLDGCTYLDLCGASVLLQSRTRTGERLRIVLPERHMINRIFDVIGLRALLTVGPSLESVVQPAPASERYHAYNA